jgi:ATP-dependent Clp protease adaptor protein ClpS
VPNSNRFPERVLVAVPRYSSPVSATLVSPTKPKHSSRGDSGLGELWRVIVLNDNHNTFDGVARALASVLPGVSFDGGMRLATEIDRTGQAIVWSGHRELAELYWSQLDARGLTMAPLES